MLDDVTESFIAAEELRESNLQLRGALQQLATAQDQAVRQERLNALGQMAAGVAHDINNSLTPLMTYAELLDINADLLSEEHREWLKLIRLGVADTAETVKRLEHFYRQSHNRDFLSSSMFEKLSCRPSNSRAPNGRTMRRPHASRSISLLIWNGRRIVKGNASQLRAVLTNLIFNSVDAISEQE